MNCGDVCLVQFPFTDGSAAKLRPVLVVSAHKFNIGADVVVVPISSKPDDKDEFSVYLDMNSPHFAATGLRYTSAIKWTKPITIAKSLLKRRLGILPEPVLDEVCQHMNAIFSRSPSK